MIELGIFYSFLSAIFKAGKSITTKKASMITDEYITSFFTRFIGIFIAIILLFTVTEFKITNTISFWIVLFLNTIVMICGTIVISKGFKLTDVSIASPLLSFVPLAAIPPAIIFLNQIPTIIAGLGVFIVTIGTYILNLKENKQSILEPFKSLFNDKGAQFILLGVCIVGFMPAFDKLGLNYTNEITWLLLMNVTSSIGIYIFVYKFSDCTISNIITNWKVLFIVGFCNTMLVIFQFIAYNYIDVVYVQAVKRVSVLMAISYGGLYMNEKHMKLRLIGGSIIIFGVILITIGA